jgi:hypothetical protein
MHGVYLAHKVGDLVRVIKYDFGTYLGSSLGIVTDCPKQKQKSIFIKVYIFETNREEFLSPHKIDIISSIEE